MNTYLVLFLVFSLLSFIGFLWLAIVAFKRGVGWGLAVLLLSPITAIVFSLVNWFDARKAFILYISTLLLSFGTLIFIYSQVGLGTMQQISAKMQRGELAPAQAYQLLSRAMQGEHADLFAKPVKAAKQPIASNTHKADLAKPAAAKSALSAAGKSTSSPTAKPLSTAEKPAALVKAKAPASVKKDVTKDRATPSRLARAASANDSPASTRPAEDPVEDDPPGPVPNINKVQKDPLAQTQKTPSDKVTVSLRRVSHYIGRSFLITLKNGTTHRGILRKVSRTRLELDLKLYGGNFVYRVDKDQISKIQMYKRISMD